MRVGIAVAALAAALGVAAPAVAQAPDVPRTVGFVVDGAQVIPDPVARGVEARLAAHQRKTTNEVVVMTMPSVPADSIESFATRAFNTLGIGDRKKQNGVLIFITPSDRKLRIVVGTGLAAQITPAEVKAIVDGRMVPALRVNDVGRAVRAGAEGVLTELGDKAPIADAPRGGRPQDGGVPLPGGLDAGTGRPPGIDGEQLERAAGALRSAAPIFVVVLLLIGVAVIGKFLRGVGSAFSGITDMASAAGYGRGVWFGRKDQVAAYGQDGTGFVSAPPLASGSSVGVATPAAPPAAPPGPPGNPPIGGGVSGAW